MQHNKILIRQLGLQPYEPVSQAMHEFTDTRDDTTLDEIWLSNTRRSLLRAVREKLNTCWFRAIFRSFKAIAAAR